MPHATARVSPLATLQLLVLISFIAPVGTRANDQQGSPRTTQGERQWRELSEGWTVRHGDREHPIRIGESWESVLGLDFDGTATYAITQAAAPRAGGGRMVLEIDGAATHSIVRCDGQQLAEHLGGWTPFRCDITDFVNERDPSSDNSDAPRQLRFEIQVDERVGHDTQGFLPIIQPHFGGIWKHVRILQTAGPVYIDDLTLQIDGFRGDEMLYLNAHLRSSEDARRVEYEIGWRIIGPSPDVTTDWQWCDVGSGPPMSVPYTASESQPPLGAVADTLRPPIVRLWSPEDPFRYRIAVAVRERESRQIVDYLERDAAIRRFEAAGRQILLNGQPIVVRGVLNWGYAPPRLAPTLDRQRMREELRFAKDRGFNLMKFCLWIPPREYLDLADEMGMLTWVEYPTWHPRFTAETLPALEKEFTEFFYYDRNSPSVVLRSLTCETGHSASLEVIQRLYDQAHAMIPGAIVEDDSSWIQWHRIHDFYDDHPYGNNHSWMRKLDQLDQHIRERDAKPLVLGEAIAADTWASREDLDRAAKSAAGAHEMRSSAALDAYTARMLEAHGLDSEQRVRTDSYRAALRMRKYQIEAYRYRLPHAGYVVSVLRDFPLASMGLIDRAGTAKWSVDDFRWHGETQLVLNRGSIERSVPDTTPWQPTVQIIAGTSRASEGRLRYRWFDRETGERWAEGETTEASGGEATLDLQVPRVERPRCGTLAVAWNDERDEAENAWDVWIVPTRDSLGPIVAHASVEDDWLRSAGIDPARVLRTHHGDGGDSVASSDAVILARRFDRSLLGRIAAGARCVMIPDGGPGGFATSEHWFLRGGPVVAEHPLAETLGHDLIVDLQTFDLAGPVLRAFPLLDQGVPIVSLWDNHDTHDFRTHTLLWETRLGQGRLLVSTLGHATPAGGGRFALAAMVDHVRQGPDPAVAMSPETVERLGRELSARHRSLGDAPWRFRVASEEEALAGQWLSEDPGTERWENLEITRHWDGQGHAAFDGWGVYRRTVQVPEDWPREGLFLVFTGVDDFYDVFVDGQRIGSGGDIENRETAFELRAGYAIPASATADGQLEIGVRVYDWQGAGGIFRPVYLSTSDTPPDRPLLVPANQ